MPESKTTAYHCLHFFNLFLYSRTLIFLLLSKFAVKDQNPLIVTNPVYFNLYGYNVKFTIFNFKATIFFWLPSSLPDLSFSAFFDMPFPLTNLKADIPELLCFCPCYPSKHLLIHWTVLCSRPRYLTAYCTMNHFLTLELNMPYRTAGFQDGPNDPYLFVFITLCYPLSH